MRKSIKLFILFILCVIVNNCAYCQSKNLIVSNEKIYNIEAINYHHKFNAIPSNSLYDLSWDNKWCHPYRDLKAPTNYKIDLTGFHIPINRRIVTSHYSYRSKFKRHHNGVDLKGYLSDTIFATWEGKIRISKYDKNGYGNVIVIRHHNGLETIYGHLSKVFIKVNDNVKSGDPIGLCGNSGRSFGSHLHFEIRFCGQHIDPESIFDFSLADIKKNIFIYK